MEASEWIQKYTNEISVKSGSSKKLFAIGMVGTTGSGKSFIANLLEKELGLFVTSNDEIRRFMNKNGLPGMFPDQKLLEKITEGTTKFLYKKRISHIIDADLVWAYEQAIKNAQNHKADFYLIRVVCPEKEIIKRLKKRALLLSQDKLKEAGYSLSGYEEYLKRTKIHNKTNIPKDKIYLEIDTSKNLKAQINILKQKLKLSGSL
jgi:dephospho-CoA kinase